jgi:ATP-dependent helicase/nuclease subunit B
MALSLLVGPPGSGRTRAMLERARSACAAGLRVWWVGLPAQRASVYRRATLPEGNGSTEGTALLGLEFLTLQQVYYRMLARGRELRPLVIGSGRLVLVGEALAEVAGAVPTPGEARLFAQAIAEAKRYGVGPAEVEGADDPERRRLAQVFAAYERRKRAADDAWDYDDFRSAARRLAEARPEACEADVVIVDGFRELGPLELRIVQALARAREVHLTLPEPPPGAGWPAPERADRPPERTVERYRAPNPVAEARWVLRALKRDLAVGGYDALDLALIAPPERVRALDALADEYGVPLTDETPRSLADTPAGRLLVELLELPDHPTPSGLLAVPELAELADAALDAGVAGGDAILALADRLGVEARVRAWLATLEVEGEPVAWARHLLHDVLPSVLLRAPEGADGGLDDFREAALRAAQEASRLAQGPGFRAWWAALLRQAAVARDLRGGVALLTPTLASGRHFRRAYLLGASEGVYGAAEREDYFVPEDDREEMEASHERLRLPRRFQGRDRAVLEELLARADELVVTVPEADQGGPLVPEPVLAGAAPAPLPEVPAGSSLELPAEARFRAEPGAVELGPPSVEALRRFDACSLRFWGESRLEERSRDAEPWWRGLRRALRRAPRLTDDGLAALAEAYPEAGAWLERHRETLLALTYGVRLPQDAGGVHAVLDGAVREGAHATLVRFVAPNAASDAAEAERTIKDRWTELWAAGHLLERYRGRVSRVDVWVWPLLGEPIDVFERGITYRWRQIGTRERRATAAFERFTLGEVAPNPGFHCRTCAIVDVCREGSGR